MCVRVTVSTEHITEHLQELARGGGKSTSQGHGGIRTRRSFATNRFAGRRRNVVSGRLEDRRQMPILTSGPTTRQSIVPRGSTTEGFFSPLSSAILRKYLLCKPCMWLNFIVPDIMGVIPGVVNELPEHLDTGGECSISAMSLVQTTACARSRYIRLTGQKEDFHAQKLSSKDLKQGKVIETNNNR